MPNGAYFMYLECIRYPPRLLTMFPIIKETGFLDSREGRAARKYGDYQELISERHPESYPDPEPVI